MRDLGRVLTPALLLFMILFQVTAGQVQAQSGILGIHILNPTEINDVSDLLKTNTNGDDWHYVTIPLSLNDLDKHDEWQTFFDEARQQKIIPIVRLTSRFDSPNWVIPNRMEVVSLISFLSQLTWPTDERNIIIFNEVNHSNEWGGQLDPASYAATFEFASSWAHSENKNYVVLPAAMDLAASNGKSTMEAFNYLNQMLAANPDIFSYADKWNSHSYPNPAFSASPTKKGQNSLHGFEYELSYLKEKTGRDFQVFITETGWAINRQTQPWLASYYTYALQHIWSNPQVEAVTPFILKGDPGPFKEFTFLDSQDRPTAEYRALQKALNTVKEGG